MFTSQCYDWPEKLLWFWFYDTRLKTALSSVKDKFELKGTQVCMQRSNLIMMSTPSWSFNVSKKISLTANNLLNVHQ